MWTRSSSWFYLSESITGSSLIAFEMVVVGQQDAVVHQAVGLTVSTGCWSNSLSFGDRRYKILLRALNPDATSENVRFSLS